MQSEPILQPIVITCKPEEEAAAFFNRYRQQHFPAAKNVLEAHLTLFHHIRLPVREVLEKVHQITYDTKPFEMHVERIAFTGRGVAFVIKSPQLIALHKVLQQSFKEVLTPQDRQAMWPHVTIQNKASADESSALAAELQQKFEPFSIVAMGLQLFYYMNGPWQFIADADFGSHTG